MSGNGTMSSYSQTPLLRDYKFTPKKADENTMEQVFWKKHNKN